MKTSYHIDKFHLDVVDLAFKKDHKVSGLNDFGVFIEWGKLVKRQGYPCIVCGGAEKMEVFEHPGDYYPCPVCAQLCPTCGQHWDAKPKS